MDFKFNFSAPSEEGTKGVEDAEETPAEKKASSAVLRPAVEVKITTQSKKDIFDGDVLAMELQSGQVVRYVSAAATEVDILSRGEETSDILKAIEQHSDLIPHVYEGGLKIWECSEDLTEYVSSLNIAFRGLNVLELGCGAALPGLYALKQGAQVHFQDYNDEVIETITIPNVLLNEPSGEQAGNYRFFAGDWGQLPDVITTAMGKPFSYDIIFTSETIYNPSDQQKLHDVLVNLLNKDGVIYLAAKTHYFGVGGGIRQFEALIEQHRKLTSEVCIEISEGVNREILELRHRQPST